MNQNTIYTQTMIQTMAGKVIRDLRRGGDRELRNMMDLCGNRSSYPYYQQFCRMVEDALRAPHSQYGRLITRAARDVSETCLKTFLSNFGYHAVFCGGEILREQKEQNASQGIWLRPFPWEGGSAGVQRAVFEWEKEGTSVFWAAQVETPERWNVLLAAAEKNRRCIFAVAHPPDTCADEQLLDAVDLGNICFFLGEEQLGAFSQRLRNVGALFGFHRSYAQVESLEAEDLFLQNSIQQGCLMGVYEGDWSQSLQKKERLYQKLIQVRSGGTREIFLCDLWRDRDAVQELLLHERTFPRCANN